jgi:sugar/nucleoside kinase (ribokinase family)
LISDYNKGFLTKEFICEIVNICRKRNVPCVADAKREPEVYTGCILKGNAEWAHTTKINLLHENLVLTYGKNPPTVNAKAVGIGSEPVECINHVGAGDCFAAHLTLALAYGFSLEEAAALAHSAGRVYVQHPHNRAPWPKEVAEDLEKRVLEKV